MNRIYINELENRFREIGCEKVNLLIETDNSKIGYMNEQSSNKQFGGAFLIYRYIDCR